MIIILWLIDTIIISMSFDIKIIVTFNMILKVKSNVLDSHKGKTRSVIRRGLMRYRLLVQTVLLIPVP